MEGWTQLRVTLQRVGKARVMCEDCGRALPQAITVLVEGKVPEGRRSLVITCLCGLILPANLEEVT